MAGQYTGNQPMTMHHLFISMALGLSLSIPELNHYYRSVFLSTVLVPCEELDMISRLGFEEGLGLEATGSRTSGYFPAWIHITQFTDSLSREEAAHTQALWKLRCRKDS